MRFTMILGVLGVCGLLAGTGCATVKSEMTTLEKNPGALKDPSALKGVGDDALAAAVKTELGKNAKTKGANLDVAVKSGIVTLKGTASAEVKAEAQKIAMVPGINSVANQIAVK
jgi:osmotically-inducible protein OsmY